MALREIRQTGDDILRKKSREVTSFDEKLHSLLDDMLETMYHYEGVGIAAVQIGVLRRAFIIELDEKIIEFVNPVVLDRKGEQVTTEGCLSVEGTNGYVERPSYIKIEAFNRDGEKFIFESDDFGAVVTSHEYDHLEGVLFVDKVLTENELIDMGYEIEGE